MSEYNLRYVDGVMTKAALNETRLGDKMKNSLSLKCHNTIYVSDEKRFYCPLTCSFGAQVSFQIYNVTVYYIQLDLNKQATLHITNQLLRYNTGVGLGTFSI